MKLREKQREMLRYVIVGATATTIHYVMYYILKLFIPLEIAYSLGFIIALIFNYFASSLFTFTTTLSFKKFIGFCISHIINYTLHTVLMNLALRAQINENLAPIPVFAIAIPINFMLVRYFLKRNSQN